MSLRSAQTDIHTAMETDARIRFQAAAVEGAALRGEMGDTDDERLGNRQRAISRRYLELRAQGDDRAPAIRAAALAGQWDEAMQLVFEALR